MIKYPLTVLPCPSPDQYDYTKTPAVTSRRVLSGRGRYELKDIHGVYLINMTLPMSDTQLMTWQTFWAALHMGKDWFEMSLYIDGTQRPMAVHAVTPWSASRQHGALSTVSLNLEGYPT